MADPQYSDLPAGAKIVTSGGAGPSYSDLPQGAKVVKPEDVKPPAKDTRSFLQVGIDGAGAAGPDAGTGLGGMTNFANTHPKERGKLLAASMIGAGGALATHVAGLGASYTAQTTAAAKGLEEAQKALKVARQLAQDAQAARKGAEAAKAMKGLRQATQTARQAKEALDAAKAAESGSSSIGQVVGKIGEYLKGPGSILKHPGGQAIEHLIEYSLLKQGFSKSAIGKVIEKIFPDM